MALSAITLNSTGQVLEWGGSLPRAAAADETEHNDTILVSTQPVIDAETPRFTKVVGTSFTAMSQPEKDAVVLSEGIESPIESTPLDLNWGIETNALLRSSDLVAEITIARSCHISSDGLKLYVGDNTTQSVYEYDLASPWDLTTPPAYTGNSVNRGVNFTDAFLKDDGTRLYIMTFAGDFAEYVLSVPFDLSTAGTPTIHNTVAASVNSIEVTNGGLDVYFTQDTGVILQWEMTTAWDLSTLVDTGKSFATGLLMTSGGATIVRPDGQRVLAAASSAQVIAEYTFDTPRDISTLRLVASVGGFGSAQELCANPHGDKLFTMTASDVVIREYALGVHSPILTYQDSPSVTQDIRDNAVRIGQSGHIDTIAQVAQVESTELPAPLLAMEIAPDGTKYFIAGNDPSILQYDMSTPWDITTESFVANTFNAGFSIQSLMISPDGLHVICVQGGGVVRFWTLPSAYDFDNAVQGASITPAEHSGTWIAACASLDGRNVYLFDSSGGLLYQYQRPGWESQTLAYTGNSINFASSNNTQCVSISSDGRTLYYNPNSDTLREYALTTPWDISTFVLTTTDLDAINTLTRALRVSPDGLHFFAGTTDINNGSVVQFSLGLKTAGLLSTGDVIAGGDITTQGRKVSALSPETKEIFSAADLDDLATAGVITIAAGEILTLDFDSGLIVTAVRFVLEGATSELRLTSDSENDTIVYVGTGDFFSGSASRVSLYNLIVVGGATGTFCNLADATLNITACQLAGWDDLGTMVASEFGKGIALFNSLLVDCDVGWDTTNCSIGTINTTLVLTGMTGPLFTVNPNTVPVLISLLVVGFFFPTGAVLRVDPALSADTRMTIASSNITSGNLFDTTGGAAGVFTAVADASVASTGIDSVSDSSGVARFNFTVGPTLHLGQEVVMVGFVTNAAYNVTGLITAVGAGFFEISLIAFGSDEASGTFTSDSVTVTSATHGLPNGATLVIDSDLTTDYDGGAVIYQAATNNFRINRSFIATESGTWDTSPIDQTDQRIIASVNPGFIDSKHIGSVHVNGNATATDMSGGPSAWTDFNLGSAAAGSSNIERFKLTDSTTGELTYTGLASFSGRLSAALSATSSGGSEAFQFRAVINGSPLVDAIVVSVELSSSPMLAIPVVVPIACVPGDTIRLQVQNTSGVSNILFQDVAIEIQ